MFFQQCHLPDDVPDDICGVMCKVWHKLLTVNVSGLSTVKLLGHFGWVFGIRQLTKEVVASDNFLQSFKHNQFIPIELVQMAINFCTLHNYSIGVVDIQMDGMDNSVSRGAIWSGFSINSIP